MVQAQEVLTRFYPHGIMLPVDVDEIARANGIEVLRARFGGKYQNSVFGFIEKADGVTTITVNRDNAEVRQRFTVAHELGHYFLHHNSSELRYLDMRSTESTHTEVEANTFAAELLMPEDVLRKEYDRLMFPTAQRLASIFDVSIQSMKYRLKKLGLEVLDMQG